jgi:hypothetical protein
MAYATLQNVYDIIGQAMTSATNSVVNGAAVPLWSFGKSKNANTIPDDVVYQYLTFASDQIDAGLSELYVTPFIEKTDLEMRLLEDVDAYNDLVYIDRASVLNPGDTLVFIDSLTEEKHTVVSTDNYLVELDSSLMGVYTVENSRVIRVKYPPTITLICARLAAANIYDKYFSAQVNPDNSNFGKTLRRWALSDINSILNGIIILHGQKRIGHRFFNPTLRDRYGLPNLEGGAGDREMKGGDQ